MKTAAWELVQERSIDTISVSDIVRRAETSRQAFYQHFADRDDAVVAAIVDDLDARVLPGDPPRQQIESLMRFVGENTVGYRNIHPSIASQRCGTELRQRMRRPSEAVVDELAGTNEGLTDTDRAALTTFLLGGFMEIALEWLTSTTGPSPEASAADLLTALGRLLAPPPSPK